MNRNIRHFIEDNFGQWHTQITFFAHLYNNIIIKLTFLLRILKFNSEKCELTNFNVFSAFSFFIQHQLY